VFSSGQSEQRPDLRGSVFTSYLLRGLSGEASSKKDGNVGLSELDAYVRSNVKIATEGRERPIVAIPSAMFVDPIIVGPNANYSKTVSVAIGNGAYRNAHVDLAFSASDAQAFGTFWKNRGARTQILVEASGDQMRRAIVDATTQADRDSLQIIYYSGH